MVVKTLFLYAIMVTGAIWEKRVFGCWLFARPFFWEDVFSMAVIALHSAYLVALASGALDARQQILLDGMNVTDPSYGTNGANINTNFIQEIDIKSGSFMPEYGRATGGIMNVVLKSGSNQYTGSIFSTFTPSFLVEPAGKTVGAAGEAA